MRGQPASQQLLSRPYVGTSARCAKWRRFENSLQTPCRLRDMTTGRDNGKGDGSPVAYRCGPFAPRIESSEGAIAPRGRINCMLHGTRRCLVKDYVFSCHMAVLRGKSRRGFSSACGPSHSPSRRSPASPMPTLASGILSQFSFLRSPARPRARPTERQAERPGHAAPL